MNQTDYRPSKKIKRPIGWVLTACALLIAFFAGCFWIISNYKDRYAKTLLERLLPIIEDATGFSISYEQISANFKGNTGLRKVVVSVNDGNQILPLAQIENLVVLYEIHLWPKVNLAFKGFLIDGLNANFQIHKDGTLNLPPVIQNYLKQKLSFKKSGIINKNKQHINKIKFALGEIIKEARLDITDGKVHLVDEYFCRSGEQAEIQIEHFAANLNLDFQRWDAKVEGSGVFEPDQGKFQFAIATNENGNSEIQGTFSALKPSILKPYLPAFVRYPSESRLDGSISIAPTYENQKKYLTFLLDGKITEGSIFHPNIALIPITGINIGLKARGYLLDVDKKIQIQDAELSLGQAKVNTSGELIFNSPNYVVSGKIRCEKVPLQQIADAIPQEFAPILKGVKLKGALDTSIHFHLDRAKPRNLIFEPEIQVNGFEPAYLPPSMDVLKLNKPFEHLARKHGVLIEKIWVGPENENFVPLNDIGSLLIGAVLTCEDGSFFKHKGINPKHIRESIIEDLEAGRFKRGGSTISMQLAKNIFLSEERNISRKFQEAVLTWLLETEVDKKRILEIYLNIIEWGPKIYGCKRAANHYFSKSPSSLTPLEAAFLASVIPGPTKYHFMYDRGYVSSQWSIMLDFVMRKMVERGTITEDQHEEADPYQPMFNWVKVKLDKGEPIPMSPELLETQPKEPPIDVPLPGLIETPNNSP